MNEEELLHRINNALVLLSDGHPFEVGDLTFSCDDKDNFYVSGWVESYELKNISKTRALKELKETKELFKKMINTSNDLKEFIEGREIEYVLSYNYGMGSLEICSEKNGIIKCTKDINDN